MSVTIKIEGVAEAQRHLLLKNKLFAMAAEKAMDEATLYVEGEVKASIAGNRAEHPSVDTGHFLQSVTSETAGEGGYVYTDVDYAKYLEYGTSKIPARRHFRNTASRVRPKVQAFVTDELRKVSD